jgi:1,4-alpha-glucan branching enzyme
MAERLDHLTVAAIVQGMHADPFSVLGEHKAGRYRVARAFVPTAHSLTVTTLDGADLGTLERTHPDGMFEGRIKARRNRGPLRLVATSDAGSWAFVDPYSFGPILGPLDDFYAAEGTHLRLFDKLGAHE